MGCYDTLGGPCPSCNEDIQEQTKYFQDTDLRSFEPGDMITKDDNRAFTIELNNCYKCKKPLFALFSNGMYMGFIAKPLAPIEYSDKSRREEISDMMKRLYVNYENNKDK